MPELVIFDGYDAEELYSHYVYRYFPNSFRILDASESQSIRNNRKNKVYQYLYQKFVGDIKDG